MKGDGWIVDALVQKQENEEGAPSDAAGCSVPSPSLRRARRFVAEFLLPLVGDGWEYGDGKTLDPDVRSLIRMMRSKMPELF